MIEISFGASFKHPVTIKKYINQHYQPFPAAIVKAEHNDAFVLEKTARNWERCFAEQAARAVSSGNENKHVYILTKQKGNYKELNPDDILGMAYLQEYKNVNMNTLEYIQVHPDIEKKGYTLFKRMKKFILKKLNKKDGPETEYLEVGTNLVKALQKYHNERKMDLCSIGTSSRFYRKLGFEADYFFNCHMVWTP